MFLSASLSRRRLRHRHLVGVGERRRGKRGQALLLELGLRLLVGRLRVLRQIGGVLAEEREQRRAGVLGVGVDLAALEGLQRGLLVTDAEVGRGRVARGGEALRIDLGEHLLLGEVLRADLQRDLGVAGVVDDLAARGRGGGRRGRGRRRLRRRLVVAAAGGDDERHGRERGGQEHLRCSAHGAVWILRLVSPKRARARASPPRSSSMPAGVTARWTADRPTSAATARAATTIEAPIWPSRP